MQRETRLWVNKAESDLECARQLAGKSPQLNDVICFHCQQAAEKYFKALLQELGLVVPRTHELESLLDLLLAHDSTLARLRRGALFLSQFAVDYRYPDANATRRQAQSAVRWAERVRVELRATLGLNS
jgi:HEPN domain-containing protein